MKVIKRWFRFLWQRWTRGFDDSQTWNLETRLAEHILPRLKRFKQVHTGYPMELTPQEWEIILDKMIFAFEFQASDIVDREIDLSNDHFDKVKEGLWLFGVWYTHLWW